MVHIEKDVFIWFQMLSRNHPFQSCALFMCALEWNLDPLRMKSHALHLLNLPKPQLLSISTLFTLS